MRTFIGISVPTRLSHELDEVLAELGTIAAAKRVAPDHLHLTLRFIGETDDEQALRLSASLMEIANSTEKFTLNCRGLGCFPNARSPRVVWAGVEAHETLARLSSDIEVMCAEMGFAKDRLPFRPHITLARIRDRRSRRASAAVRDALRELIETHADSQFFTQDVDAVTFFQSELTSSGVKYTELKRAVFGG